MNSHKAIDEKMNESDDSYSNDEKSEDEEEEESRTIGKTDESLNKTEYDDLLDILVNKSKNVTELPKMNYSKLAREYIEASDSKEAREYKETSDEKAKKRTEARIPGRIKNLLSKVPTIDRLDTDTKVKLFFVFSVPIERDFLMKLRENATVKLDYAMRIIEYKQTGGGLELKGTHKPKIFINDRENKMLDFLAQQCLLLDSPPTLEWLAEIFNETTGLLCTSEHSGKQMRGLRKKIYETEYDIQLRVRMLFITSARLQSVVLQELRKDAQVEVDEENRITKYEANDGSLSLRGDHSNSSKGLFGFDQKRQRLLAESNKKKDDSGNKENDKDSKRKTKKGYASSDGEEPEKMKTSAIVKMNSGNKKDNEDEGRRERQARREIKRQSVFPDNEDDGAGEKKEIKKKRKIVDKEIEVKVKRKCERRTKVERSKESNSGDQSAISTSSDGAKEDDDSPLHSIDTTDSENGNLQSQHRQKDGKVQIPDKNKKVQRSENRLKEVVEMERGEQEDEEEHAEEVERSVSRSIGPLSDEFSYEPQEPHPIERNEENKPSLVKSSAKHHPIPFKTEPDSTFMESANKRMKLEPFEGELKEGVSLILDEGDDYIEEIPIQEEIIPKQEPEEIVEIEDQNSQSKILEAFHTFVISLDIGQLQDIQKKIEIKMKNTMDEQIPSKNILAAFSSCLLMINRNGLTELKINGSYRLKDFLLLFRQFIISLKAPGLDGFLNEIKKDKDDASIADKRVAIGIIKTALETVLNILFC